MSDRVDPDTLAEAVEILCLECNGKGTVGPIPTGNDTWTYEPCRFCDATGRRVVLTPAAARAFLEAPTADHCWTHKRHPNDGEHLGRCDIGRVRLVAAGKPGTST